MIIQLVQVSEQGTDIIIVVLQENQTDNGREALLRRNLRRVPVKAKTRLMKRPSWDTETWTRSGVVEVDNSLIPDLTIGKELTWLSMHNF